MELYEYLVNDGASMAVIIRNWLPFQATLDYLKIHQPLALEGKNYVTQEHISFYRKICRIEHSSVRTNSGSYASRMDKFAST